MKARTKIRVLECIRQGKVGGGESHLISLVEHLDQSIFEPFVLSFTDGPMIDHLKKMDIPTKIIPSERAFDFSVRKKVNTFLKEIQPDLIHAHGSRACSNLIGPAKKQGIPVIYTIHGWSFHDDQGFLMKNLRILGEQYLVNRTALNIAVSESNKKTGQLYLKGFEATVINNGIDLSRFCSDEVHSSVREELNISNNKFLVCFIARFTKQKQPLLMIQGFSELLQKNSEVHLLMVGEGELLEEAKQQVKKLEIENAVTFQPFRKDVPELLKASDVYVLPSLWEGLPIGLLEAMAMEKPVIASNVDGTKELILHHRNGVLIEPQQLSEQLVPSLLNLINNSDKCRQYGREARKTVLERFSVLSMTKKVENCYHSLIGQ